MSQHARPIASHLQTWGTKPTPLMGIALLGGLALLAFISHSSRLLPMQQLQLSSDEHEAMMRNHNFVVIGGPHAGGCSLLWKLIESHPSVSGLPVPNTHSPTELSEGRFLQNVLPTFGVHPGSRSATAWGFAQSAESGLGRYAFSASSHLTELHTVNSRSSSQKLMSDWAFHWNLSRPILLEKTPTNMLTSRLLQGLLGPSAKFLFITRHPLAVSLAHRRWPSCKHLSLAELNLHWLAAHRILRVDLPYLREARVLRYEDLTLRTRTCVLEDVFAWLQLSPVVDIPRRVDARANAKQEDMLCRGHLLRTTEQLHRFCAMTGALQPALNSLALGYDFHGNKLGFQCVREILANSSGACDGIEPSPWIARLATKQVGPDHRMGHAHTARDQSLLPGLCATVRQSRTSSSGAFTTTVSSGSGTKSRSHKAKRQGAARQQGHTALGGNRLRISRSGGKRSKEVRSKSSQRGFVVPRDIGKAPKQEAKRKVVGTHGKAMKKKARRDKHVHE